jgi:hypothetical protein
LTETFANQTTLHPVALVVLLIMAAATLAAPRRYAPVPLFLTACFVSQAQRIVVFTLDFDLLRILTTIGWVRVFLKGETA